MATAYYSSQNSQENFFKSSLFTLKNIKNYNNNPKNPKTSPL